MRYFGRADNGSRDRFFLQQPGERNLYAGNAPLFRNACEPFHNDPIGIRRGIILGFLNRVGFGACNKNSAPVPSFLPSQAASGHNWQAVLQW